MLRWTRLLQCRVSTQNYKSKITAATRKTIAGLDADAFGFSRLECCGPVLAKLPGSFQMTDHVILNTVLTPTDWAKRNQNVPLYEALEKKLQEELPSAKITLCHTLEYPPNSVFRFNLDDEARGKCWQYTVGTTDAKDLPWKVRDAQPVDCTSHYFVFVCSHKSRDARCGYCGPVLVDILSQEMKRAVPNIGTVHVIPCSHFGGHVYAGNVLIYSKHGGICFGCVTPSDTTTIADFVRKDDGVVPDTLKGRVRGRMTSGTPNASAAHP